MIRVSIEVPDNFKYRLTPIIDLRREFAEDGIAVGFDLKSADLRILNHDYAIRELAERPGQRFSTPVIVDERIDGAQIINSSSVRSLMAHPDVKFWLKRNTFRDYKLNNVALVADRYHYQLLNEIPEFHLDAVGPPISMVVTPEMANKIRLLPTVSCARFAYFREQRIDWDQKRPIDVSFAGLVDYEVRATDYWDGKLAEAHAASQGGIGFMPSHHRRAAARQLTQLRHLRVVIGMNRALQADLYQATLMRSSISVSPWGFGEYGYRDYESILAGCVTIKPPTDHVATFAPDIYQSGKYYTVCKPDFSDLPELVESIMSNRSQAVDMARRAREDMLATNTSEIVYAYYLDLFQQALGRAAFEERWHSQSASVPVMFLSAQSAQGVRAEIVASQGVGLPLDLNKAFTLNEDHSPHNSHDVRLSATGSTEPGLYRLRFMVRKLGRQRAAVQLHVSFKDQIWINVNLTRGGVEQVNCGGELLRSVYGPEVAKFSGGWIFVVVVVQVTDLIDEGLGLALYAADVANHVYDGDGRPALEVAMLELTRIDLRA